MEDGADVAGGPTELPRVTPLTGIRHPAADRPGPPAPVTDLADVRRDDAEARFDAFYAATNAALLGQLVAMCGDLGEAQDCLQEAYVRAWQRWHVVGEYDVPAAWVRQVAWRLAVNRFHKARNAMTAWRRRGPAADVADLSPDSLVLAAALQRIPEVQREAIVLHHLAGMTVEEIAAQNGVPTGTVKARLTRGRARLAELLSDEELTR